MAGYSPCGNTDELGVRRFVCGRVEVRLRSGGAFSRRMCRRIGVTRALSYRASWFTAAENKAGNAAAEGTIRRAVARCERAANNEDVIHR